MKLDVRPVVRRMAKARTVSLPRLPSMRAVLIFFGTIFLALFWGLAVAVLGGILPGIAFLVLGFSLLILFSYRIGLWLCIMLIPFSGTHLFPHQMLGIPGMNPLNALFLATTFSIALRRFSYRDSRPWPKFDGLFWFLIVPVLLAALNGVRHYHQIPLHAFESATTNLTKGPAGYLAEMLRPMILPFLAYMLAIDVVDRKRAGSYLFPMFFSAGTLICVAVGVVLTSGVSLNFLATTRARAIFDWTGMHANNLGLLFNTMFVLALFTWSKTESNRPFAKFAFAAAAAVGGFGVLMTFSRGAFAGMAVAVTYFLISRKQFATTVFGFIAVAIALFFVPEQIFERALHGVSTMDWDAISAGRIYDIWIPLLPGVLDAPIFGHGIASVMWSEPMRRGLIIKMTHTHNAYLGMLLDFGVIGTAVVAVFWYRLWRTFRQAATGSESGLWRGFFEGGAICILVLMIQGVTDDRFIPTNQQVLLWIAAGLAVGFANLKEPQTDRPPETELPRPFRPGVRGADIRRLTR